jgi:hypothetical protein
MDVAAEGGMGSWEESEFLWEFGHVRCLPVAKATDSLPANKTAQPNNQENRQKVAGQRHMIIHVISV